MKPERIPLKAILATGNTSLLNEIALRISQGAVFIYPTETIYGIGGRFDDANVYHRIQAVKGRSSDKQMIFIGGSEECFTALELDFPEAAIKCASAFWPGLLTMVLPSSKKPEGVAIRISDHPFITALSTLLKVPLFSTSANLSCVPYNPDPETIYRTIGNNVDFMVDAGDLPQSLPSTIIRVYNDDRVVVVREGCIPTEKIVTILGTSEK